MQDPVSVFDPLIVLWAAIGASVTVFVGVRLWSRWYQGPKDSSLGSVSDQWLAEQRLNRPDSQR
jgi:hypothetical protein